MSEGKHLRDTLGTAAYHSCSTGCAADAVPSMAAVGMCSGAHFQQVVITCLSGCSSASEEYMGSTLSLECNQPGSINDCLMLSKHDLWLYETIALMFVGTIYYLQSLIFHLIFGHKIVLIHMFSGTGNVNGQSQLFVQHCLCFLLGAGRDLSCSDAVASWELYLAASMRAGKLQPFKSSYEVRALQLLQLLAS